MMAKSVDQMCDKYELKLRTGRIMSRLDGDRAAQVAAFRRYAVQADEKRVAISKLLGREGVFTIWWPYYEDFTRVLAKQVARLGSPDVLCLAARAELENWVKRGLERSALEAIARDVFALDLTGPIKPLDGSQTQT
jgi:hypothetical protein